MTLGKLYFQVNPLPIELPVAYTETPAKDKLMHCRSTRCIPRGWETYIPQNTKPLVLPEDNESPQGQIEMILRVPPLLKSEFAEGAACRTLRPSEAAITSQRQFRTHCSRKVQNF